MVSLWMEDVGGAGKGFRGNPVVVVVDVMKEKCEEKRREEN